MLKRILNNAWVKKLILIGMDAASVAAAYLLASFFSAGGFSFNPGYIHVRLYVFITVITIIVFYLLKFYSSVLRYAGIEEIIRIIMGISAATGVAVFFEALAFREMTAEQFLVAWAIQLIFVVFPRVLYRLGMEFLKSRKGNKDERKRLLIIGAGEGGVSVVRNLSAGGGMKAIAFIDDDVSKQKHTVCGVSVVGGREKIAETVKKRRIDIIVLAIPSLDARERKKIINICVETGAEVRTVPSMEEMILNNQEITKTRKIDFGDFLGRDEVSLNIDEVKGFIAGKTVLVTGGGGSIGSELCRQIARFSPKKLVVFDIYENNAYDLQMEFSQKYGEKLDFEVVIGSVRDKKRLTEVFKKYKPEVVLHAAAHKHVPLMEFSPAEAVKNNVFGTLNLVKCADKQGVQTFVLISTDKAVNPTNVMGATKRIAEMIVQSFAKSSKTKFVAVRFGNVLGSNGSVIPLFRRQIAAGGPVTVTHPDIIRYFMTIPEAAQLVLQAGAIAEGGEIFILDMGQPVKIADLAEKIIKFEGYRPGVDIKIEYTGLRAGEKLFEELLLAEEGTKATKHNKIYVAHPTEIAETFLEEIYQLEALYNSADELRAQIEKLIGKTLKPAANSDWFYDKK